VNAVSETARQRLSAEIADLSNRAIAVSREIHQDPELAFREHHAASLLTGWLEDEDFAVERGIAGLETAFMAVRGSGEPRIAYLLEYDALPDLGHGCGHNLIAAGGAAAAIALARTLDGPGPGTVHVVGTPAEEDGGGKIIELEAGVFDGMTAAMMFHPADRTLPTRRALACIDYKLTYRGVAAHAAKNPHDGVNALAAMIQFFVALDGMRQQLDPRARIHGIITKGGSAANVIPDLTEASFIVRHVTGELTQKLAVQVENCARAAALATGATCELRQSSPMYEERNDNRLMADRAGQYLAEAGLDVTDPSDDDAAGSSDIGNLSQRLPCIHPYAQIAPEGTPGHSVEMREAAASDAGHQAALKAALALARLGADLLTDSRFREQVRAEFEGRS
jgi:amidohydrolase